jgi:serine protease Do
MSNTSILIFMSFMISVGQAADLAVPVLPTVLPEFVAKPQALAEPASTPAKSDAPSVQAPANQTSDMSADQIFSKAQASVFRLSTRLIGVHTESGHGTGFAISNTQLVTNFHVVADVLEHPDKYELVLDLANEPVAAHIEAVDAVNDLALVKANITFSTVLKVANEPSTKRGEILYSLGFPKSETLTLIQGNSNGDRLMGFTDVLGATLPLNPGMSGGPCLNHFGEVVGVNRAMLVDAQNISYLSPWSALKVLVDKAPAATPIANRQWHEELVSQIEAQEKTSSDLLLKQPELVQKIGKISFQPPLKNARCGQDNLDGHADKAKIFLCEGVSLALIKEKSEALQVATYAMQTDSHMGGTEFYAILDRKLDKAKSNNVEPRTALRGPASLGMGKALDLANTCGLNNVVNSNGVKLTVRYCGVAISDFKGLFSTFVKVDHIGKDGLVTRFAQAYQGLSMKTTTDMIEKFLESIKVEE